MEYLDYKNSAELWVVAVGRTLLLGFAALLVVITGQARSHAAESLSLYLPLHSDQFPDVVNDLKAALQEVGIQNLTVETADYWQGYQQGLRHGRKGIYYAAPHFAAWSVNQHGFEPLLRLKESLKYVVANKRGNFQFFEINDLSNQKVCTQRPLNLDYILVNTGFDNPVLSAQTVSVWSVLEEIDNPKNDCVAFSISDHAFIERAKKQPQEFIRLQQGPQFNNYVFITHPSLSTSATRRIREFLLREKVQSIMQPVYKLTSTKTTLVDAQRQDYPRHYMKHLALYWQRKQ